MFSKPAPALLRHRRTLPKSVPLHIRGPVDVAIRAAKQAWLIETKRADILGKEVSDERLNHLYKQGRNVVFKARRQIRCASTAKHLYLRLPPSHALSRDSHMPHATQMKSYVNASQKQSFEDQLARGL